jgi:lipocalin
MCCFTCNFANSLRNNGILQSHLNKTKKNIFRIYKLLFKAINFVNMAQSESTTMGSPQTSPTLVFDRTRYFGKWFDLQHIPIWFQPSSSRNTTAEYSPTEDGNIIVHNEQTNAKGKREGGTAVAKLVADNSAESEQLPEGAIAALSVSFYSGEAKMQAKALAELDPSAVESKPFVRYLASPKTIWQALVSRLTDNRDRANYIIYALGQDNETTPYTWALVGSPDRKSGWVLSRSTSLPCSVWKQVRAEQVNHGFVMEKFIAVPQLCF